MAITINEVAQNNGGDGIVTELPGGTLNLYGGTPPASAKATQTNDVIAAGTTPAFGAHDGDDGSDMAAPAELTGTSNAGSGADATHFRFIGNDTPETVIQGTVTGTGGGGDMELDNVNIANEQAVNITGFNFTMPDGT